MVNFNLATKCLTDNYSIMQDWLDGSNHQDAAQLYVIS